MRALLQTLAWLWAAVWVRWRLLAIRTRRLFAGGEPAAATGSGYYLSPAEIPVEGIDYELVDLPPELTARLDAARVELVDQARSATTRRARRHRTRRRRTSSLVAAALVTLAALGAGATALVGGSTGVPAIDRLLGVYEAGETHGPGPSGRDLQPEPSSESTSMVIPLDRSLRAVATAYVARDGKVCLAMRRIGRGAPPSGDVACDPPRLIAERLSDKAAFAVATNRRGEEVIVLGYADDRIVALDGSGPKGALAVHLGRSWTPGVDWLGRVKPFVAVGPAASGLAAIDPSEYVFHGTTEDGEDLGSPPP